MNKNRLIFLNLWICIFAIPQMQGMSSNACTGTATTPAPAAACDQKKIKKEAQTCLTPLAQLYTEKFPQGMTKNQWQTITASLFPILLEPIRKLEHGGSVNSAAWAPNGTHLATASDDRTAVIWDRQGN